MHILGFIDLEKAMKHLWSTAIPLKFLKTLSLGPRKQRLGCGCVGWTCKEIGLG